MPRRPSNKARIQKAAEEATATKKAKKKTAKKKAIAKKTTKKKTTKKKTAIHVRMKIVWAVCDPGGKILKTFPYPLKPAAETEAKRLTDKKKTQHKVRPEKVPMEDDE